MDILSEIVNGLICEYSAYLAGQEADRTERARRAAVLSAKTKQLEAYTELMHKYFEGQMQERTRLFRSASMVLDKAMETGDAEIARSAIITIGIVHKKSPFSF